jgi:hypothetical protein
METQPPPLPGASQPRASSSYKGLALASWILLGGTALVSLVPFLGFGAWVIAAPVFIATFVLGILILTRGGTLQGVLVLISTIIVVPIFIAIAPILSSALVGAAANSGSPESNSSPSSFAASQPSTRTAAASATPTRGTSSYKIGDTVKFDDSECVVAAAEDTGSTLPGGGTFSSDKSTSGKFIIVKFRVTNTKNEEEAVIDTPKLVDSRGRKFEQMDDAQLYLPDGAAEMTLEQLPAGLTKTFYAIYEIPRDATGLSFEARSLGFNPDYARVDIGK